MTHLGERSGRSTEVDVFFDGPHRVSVECKFTEREFGRCSRPALKHGRDKNYATEHCDGRRALKRRCQLSAGRGNSRSTRSFSHGQS